MLTLPDFKEKKIIIAFSQKGDTISFKNDNIVIKDEDNKIKCQYTCYKIFLLLIVGGFSITSGLVERAKKFGFSIVFMNCNFKIYSSINYKMEGNTLLREKQYTNNKSNEISKNIIINKIKNQCETLKKIRNNNEDLKSTINLLNGYIIFLEKENLESTEIMGIEGIAAKMYFKEMFKEVNWKGRQPRVKRDQINLLLDIGYTILFNYIEAIVNVYGFDIYKGSLHKEFFKRKSLICDLIEPFRPIIDYKIRKMYNLSQISKEDFIVEKDRYTLLWKSNSKYIDFFTEEILKYKECVFKFIQNYYRWFMKDADTEKFPFVDLEEE